MIAEILDTPPAERTIPARRAALSTALRMIGRVDLLDGRPDAITVTVDDEQVAAWILYGLRSVFDHRWRPAIEPLRPDGLTLRVTRGAAQLALRTGLLNGAGHLGLGLPTDLAATTSRPVLVGVWQGAMLSSGRFITRCRSGALLLKCPTQEAALTLAGVARRLGIEVAISRFDIHEVIIRSVHDITTLLTLAGAPETAGRTYRMRTSEPDLPPGPDV